MDQLVLLEEFERSAKSRRTRAIEALEDDQRRHDEHRREEAKREKEEHRRLEEAVLATVEQVAHFQEQLDRYDTGVVTALMENRRALDYAEDRVADMSANAFTLPDGRRVFRSEDGHHVFDENGTSLGLDVVDPASVNNSAPTWEAWRGGHNELQRLTTEREHLLTFQSRVDHAREQASRDGVTQTELQTLGDDLGRTMPDAVRRTVYTSGQDGKIDGPSAGVEPGPSAAPTLVKPGATSMQLVPGQP